MAPALLSLASQLPTMARDRSLWEAVSVDLGGDSKPFCPPWWGSPGRSAQAE